jgi:hypothetical protein
MFPMKPQNPRRFVLRHVQPFHVISPDGSLTASFVLEVAT